MSQTKVQLIAPIGVVTASTLETTGVLTATTFVGDIAGTVTGITSTTDNLNLGIITATSFAGDFTGIGSGLTGTPNVVAGVVTATKFVGNTPGTVSGIADGTNINAGIITATSFVGNLTGNAAGLSTTTAHVNLGIVTATSFHGSGANLEGVSSGPVAQQAVTANSSTTTIDLSNGNLIYMTQSANTTVAFANTEGNTDVVYLVRIKDDNTTTRTLTWPSGLVWDNDTEPTLLQNAGGVSKQGQTFKLTTRDNGATWYGSEVVTYDIITGYTLWSWGGNEASGQLGLNAPSNSHKSSPTQIPGTDWARLANSRYGYGSVVLKDNKTLWGWGRNGHGILGPDISVPSQYSSPVQIPGTWENVSQGLESAMAVKRDGTLWAWGENHTGQLGLNDTTDRSSPTQIGSETTWSTSLDRFADSGYRAMAIKTDGTLWMWGLNHSGELGLNEHSAHKSSPCQIPGTTWAYVSQGGTGGAIKTDGTLWTWGANSHGQLGLNTGGTPSHISSPTQVPGTNWRTYNQGGQLSLATKTDGTLWAWGLGGYGNLGQNEVNPKYSSPVQIGSSTDWGTKNSVKGTWWAALKTDGTMWACGANYQGALGQNDIINRSSPVQVPGTWVDLFTASEQGCLGLK